MIQQTLDKIRAAGIVSILRGLPEDKAEAAVSALYEGGIRAVEVALNSPGALKTIEKLKSRFGHRMLVGAGTVLDAKSATGSGAGRGGFCAVADPFARDDTNVPQP